MGKKNSSKQKKKQKENLDDDNKDNRATKSKVEILHEEDADKEDMVDNDDDDDSSSSSDEGDDLVLEGMLCRVHGVESSSDDDDDDDDEEENNEPPKKKSKQSKTVKTDSKKANDGKKNKKNKTPKQSKDEDDDDTHNDMTTDEPEIVNVDFVFCDMNEKYFHGIKTHLMSSNDPVHAPQSSNLSNLMIENVSVGTVLCIENDDDNNVYGFATVLSLKHNPNAECLHYLSKLCLDHCPSERKKELGVVLSGKTKRPAGFLIHARMVNIPLEITEVLHQQLVLDMDWAVKNAEGGEDERKALDFGAFVRMAPTYQIESSGGDGNDSLAYRYFDDEVFANRAEFIYTFDAPKKGGAGDSDAQQTKQLCTVIVMTKTGHQDAMKDLAKMIHGS